MNEATIERPVGAQLLTHSRRVCASTCLRKHFYRYELGLVPLHESDSMRFGTLYHRALELTDLGTSDEDVATEVRAKAKSTFEAEAILRLWMGHRWYWQNDAFEVVETEKAFDLPIFNPETGGRTPTWRNAGKRDRIVRLSDGRTALQEYKSTSHDIRPGSTYWMRLRVDQQISAYMIAAREEGIDVRSVVYDVSLRPALRPLLATPVESRKFTKEGKLYANQRFEDETPEAYGERVGADIAERPDHYYQRIEVARTEDDLREFEQELWDQQKTLAACQKHGRWYRNTAACVGMFTCDYLTICSERTSVGRDREAPLGFRLLEDVHPELTAPEGD